jgi:hypothetical protein
VDHEGDRRKGVRAQARGRVFHIIPDRSNFIFSLFDDTEAVPAIGLLIIEAEFLKPMVN